MAAARIDEAGAQALRTWSTERQARRPARRRDERRARLPPRHRRGRRPRLGVAAARPGRRPDGPLPGLHQPVAGPAAGRARRAPRASSRRSSPATPSRPAPWPGPTSSPPVTSHSPPSASASTHRLTLTRPGRGARHRGRAGSSARRDRRRISAAGSAARVGRPRRTGGASRPADATRGARGSGACCCATARWARRTRWRDSPSSRRPRAPGATRSVVSGDPLGRLGGRGGGPGAEQPVDVVLAHLGELGELGAVHGVLASRAAQRLDRERLDEVLDDPAAQRRPQRVGVAGRADDDDVDGPRRRSARSWRRTSSPVMSGR